jgi:hypothetical protein
LLLSSCNTHASSYNRTARRYSLSDEKTYTADQVATAARELRQAAGAGEERFTAAQVAAMLAREIGLLRERGFSDQRIADLFSGFDIDVAPEDISQN